MDSNKIEEIFNEFDVFLEKAISQRTETFAILQSSCSFLERLVPVQSVIVTSYDEKFELISFPIISKDKLEVLISGYKESLFTSVGDSTLYYSEESELIDKYKAYFFIEVNKSITDEQKIYLKRWLEFLDNHLALLAKDYLTQKIKIQLNQCLTNVLLKKGLDQSLDILEGFLGYKSFGFFYYNRHKNNFDSGQNYFRSRMDEDSKQLEKLSPRELKTMLENLSSKGDFSLNTPITDYQEAIVGWCFIIDNNEFTSFEKSLFESFISNLRLRVVDFNKEYRKLSLTFNQSTVSNLLDIEGYREKYLCPKNEETAILYTDLSGFTRVSEQILKDPLLIGEMINIWSEKLVKVIWDHGGVFDKLVGDCVIALWGPPFYDIEKSILCEKALDCAKEIRKVTQELRKHETLSKYLRDQDFGVATGINFAPLYVGLFGPGEDYTGFSSGMNNTARLQGVASMDEILCMESFANEVNEDYFLEEIFQAKVKNVRDPLMYKKLK
jgi:adenylate cyclase